MTIPEARSAGWAARVGGTLLTLVLLDCLMLAGTWVHAGAWGPHQLALEAVVVAGAFLALPRSRVTAWAAAVISLLAVLVGLTSLADAGMRESLARPLNLYLDLQLADSVVHLLQGALGPVRGPLLLGLGLLGVGAFGVALAVLLHRLGDARPGWRARVPGALVVALALAAIPLRWSHPAGVALALPSLHLASAQVASWRMMQQELAAFERELAAPLPRPWTGPGTGTATGTEATGDALMLQRLAGRDVVLAFIESYGMTALDDPRYAPVVRPRLDELDVRLREAGLHVVTGQLEAPSQGGMSWLGHGSVLSGLWLDTQPRYDLLMASERTTLIDDFAEAGYHTAALMPAITLAWPEGVRLGYDELRVHAEIDYAGPPLNWVTMPDQFTWSYLENTIRHRADDKPVFAELGLISSHAPWTPILEVIDDWSAIGDGRIFESWADAGERPEELWKDSDRVREHYARSVAYAVETMGSWAAHHVDDQLMLIALGDHQPAPLITGDDAPRTVPIHVITADAELLQPFVDWGFRMGVDPAGTPVRRMNEFRPWFVQAYSQPDRLSGSSVALQPVARAASGPAATERDTP